jgi:hypothetical protein
MILRMIEQLVQQRRHDRDVEACGLGLRNVRSVRDDALDMEKIVRNVRALTAVARDTLESREDSRGHGRECKWREHDGASVHPRSCARARPATAWPMTACMARTAR